MTRTCIKNKREHDAEIERLEGFVRHYNRMAIGTVDQAMASWYFERAAAFEATLKSMKSTAWMFEVVK